MEQRCGSRTLVKRVQRWVPLSGTKIWLPLFSKEGAKEMGCVLVEQRYGSRSIVKRMKIWVPIYGKDGADVGAFELNKDMDPAL